MTPSCRPHQRRFWMLLALAALIAAATLAPATPPERARGAPPGQQATPVGSRVRVWWPDELYPAGGSAAEDILLRQWDGFRSTYRSYDLEIRRKRASGLGGILSTLRAASGVAPGALPDLTLMRRADMVAAAAEGLLVPVADWVPADLLAGDLLPGVEALGEIEGVLYGVPYALTLTHTLYRPSALSTPPRSFADILRDAPHYLFAGGSGSSAAVNTTVLLQYTHAGGRLVDAAGDPALDRDPLLRVLQYYATGVAQGIFGPELLEYSLPASYWNAFAGGDADLIGVESSFYLSHQSEVPNAALATTPTHDGAATTALNGWMWVLVTHDADRQDRARAFLSWMMRVSQQAALTEALGVVPSQTRALALWQNQTYAQFATGLFPSGQIVAGVQRNSAAAALQASFADVLEGIAPEQAADEAIASLAE
ncbi:MAG: extracellular solute-binding protein [Anaerolineae bacterium]|nr:extracellular solute-binding protein [Anaerolineae bacterium]